MLENVWGWTPHDPWRTLYCEDPHTNGIPSLMVNNHAATVGPMSNIFLGLVLIFAAVQTAWALLAEGQLLALPVVAVMFYEGWKNLKGYTGLKQISHSPDAPL